MFHRQLIFNGAHTTGWFLFSVAVVLAAAALIVTLLRYERRLVPRSVGNSLLVLRLAVLGTLLLTFLQPIVTWTIDRERTGRILVAVDLSESMSTLDAHASPAEKLRWARALGMIGNEVINDRLDGWIRAYEEGREPEWVDADETSDPARHDELAAIRRENLEGIFAEIDRLSRKEIGLRLLTGTVSPLLPELEKLGRVEVSVFAGQTEPADAETLSRFIGDPPASVMTGMTALNRPLAVSQDATGQSPLVAVVLLSDGRDNAQGDPIRMAGRLGAVGAKVYPVMLGSLLQPKDLAIAALDFPLTAFKDDKPLLKATLNTSQFEGEEVTVVLERAGAEPLTRSVVPEGTTATVEFDLDASKVGRQEYTIRTDVRPGETRDDNNQKSFGMHVVDDTVRVLLLDGEARWEFRFLQRALERDAHVDVKQVVFRQPYLGVLPDTFFPRRLDLPDMDDDLANSPFSEFDLVIVGDVSPTDLSPAAWTLLEKFVTESGGTLVFVAGKKYFPLAHRSEVVDRLVPVLDLQPVDINDASAEGPPTERGFRLQLTPDGEAEPMLQFAADADENRDIWSGLPGHLWGLFGRAKPGASVFAYALRPDEEPSLELERSGALFVHQHYGFGQVLWIGIDSTWRWRHRVGDQYHHRFWGQLGRWAAENKAVAGNEFVKFGPDRTDVEVGQDAVVRARWTRQFLRRFPKLVAEAEIYRRDAADDEKPFSTIPLKPDPNRPLNYEGRAVSLPAGEYRVKLAVAGADVPGGAVETTLYVHEVQTPELSNLSANRDLLAQLANVSDGRLLLPDEVAELPDLIVDPTESASERREVELWDHWLVLLLFFALLTAEWVTRKLNGLP